MKGIGEKGQKAPTFGSKISKYEGRDARDDCSEHCCEVYRGVKRVNGKSSERSSQEFSPFSLFFFLFFFLYLDERMCGAHLPTRVNEAMMP